MQSTSCQHAQAPEALVLERLPEHSLGPVILRAQRPRLDPSPAHNAVEEAAGEGLLAEVDEVLHRLGQLGLVQLQHDAGPQRREGYGAVQLLDLAREVEVDELGARRRPLLDVRRQRRAGPALVHGVVGAVVVAVVRGGPDLHLAHRPQVRAVEHHQRSPRVNPQVVLVLALKALHAPLDLELKLRLRQAHGLARESLLRAGEGAERGACLGVEGVVDPPQDEELLLGPAAVVVIEGEAGDVEVHRRELGQHLVVDHVARDARLGQDEVILHEGYVLLGEDGHEEDGGFGGLAGERLAHPGEDGFVLEDDLLFETREGVGGLCELGAHDNDC
mmetsp:Transcript_27523/g.72707  ORF Transcript_27523/g.72707 Transcript_27523/m.72707 type:complete len:332 (-) Transcript_27523:333-1328(-)